MTVSDLSESNNSALLEIGCEELPAALLPNVLENMRILAEETATTAGVSFTSIHASGTPLRLVLGFEGLSKETLPRENVIVGPPLSASGNWPDAPSPAAIGFARTHGLPVEKLELVALPKGRYLAARKKEESRPVFDLLPDIFLRTLQGLSFPKSMRWGRGKGPFLRPVLWILALYRDEVVGFEFGGQISGRLTFSPRYLAMEPVLIRNVAQYHREVMEWGIELDMAMRQAKIENDIILSLKLEEGSGNWPDGVSMTLDPDLLQEVACLVEGYRVVPAALPFKFRTLPPSVIRTVLKVHQRFFVVDSPDGKSVEHFMGISANPKGDLAVVRDGYIRVVTARLEDAAYYIARDKAQTLADRVPELDTVVFFPKVGSIGDKVRATRRMALECLALLSDDHLKRHEMTREKLSLILDRAASLYKADLLTGLVKEFPELEGEIGGTYYRWEQEKSGSDPLTPSVARAIATHYQPRTFRDPCPEDLPSAILSLADRAVSQAGAFLGGANPSGSMDPFALRRTGQGMIRLLIEHGWPIRFSSLSHMALASWNLPDTERVLPLLIEFWEDRLLSTLVKNGESHWGRAARLGDEPPCITARRAEFLQDFYNTPDFPEFEMVKTRIERILPEGSFGPVNPDLLKEPEEKALWESLALVEQQTFSENPDQADFAGEVRRLRPVLPLVETFFNAVLVNDQDPAVRTNRMALLSVLSGRLALLGHLDIVIAGARKERSNA